ncbi:MAG: TIGR02099 family protein [Pseudomonadota bacterium]|nr:TIGR02099 family protein [Pseudomonadota bacterium]
MSPSLQRRLRLARRGLWYALAIGLVLMALAAGVVSQLLPLAERHPDVIAEWLGERIDRPVAFDRVQTSWTRRGPLLQLDGLRLGEGANTIRVGDAEMLVSQYAGLLPGRSFTELRLRGLELTLERGDDGRWQVRGLPGQAASPSDPFAALEGLGELQVIGGKLAIDAPSLGIDARLPRVDMRLQVDGDRVRMGMRAWARQGSAPVSATVELDRRSGDGRAHVEAAQVDLAAWSSLLHLAGVVAESGTGRGQAWATLHGNRIASVLVDGSFDVLALRGVVLANGSVPRARFEQVQGRVRWQLGSGGWRVDAPRLRIGGEVLDGLVVAGGERNAVLAQRLQVGFLLRVLALSDRLDPGLRQWLAAAAPHAVLHDLEFVAAGDTTRASARVEDLGFSAAGDAPGFTGLSGRLQGDAHGFAFELDPKAAFRFDWPAGFGVPHPARLQGSIAGWREGEGWRVETPALQVRGADFGVDVRGGLWFQGDGTRPWIDLAARVLPTQVTTASGFWIHHRMAPQAIAWLDAALVAGQLRDARALVSGDLDDWPFRDAPGAPARGRFEATARIVDATLAFQPDWPPLEHVDGDLSFVADGFEISGKGELAGVGIQHFEAGIARFGRAPLRVSAQGGGDASRLVGLLRRSPLHARYGDTLDNVSASGRAEVTFDMELPFQDKAGARIDGRVTLADAKLADKRWNLAFEGVSGRARYGDDGFVAERLDVRHEDAPGILTLRAGEHVRDRGNDFEAELEGNLPAERLLQRVPELSWLQGRASGRSQWTAALAFRDASATLELRSSLVGTALSLPAPLRKTAEASLPATIETALPLGDGEVRVTLGRRLALRARSAAGATGVRVVLGGASVDEPPPASGLVVTGRTDALDALDWVGVARGGAAADAKAEEGLALSRIDVAVGRLNLLGAGFRDTRLQLARDGDALQLRLQGDAIAGNVRIPDAAGATVSGRFEHVRWPLPPPAVDSKPAAATTAGQDGAASTDPSKIPPLSFDIARLQVGEAVLGAAQLRTRQVPAGMRITRLDAQAPGQRIEVRGDWLGQGPSARSRLQATIESSDFGGLFSGLGHGGQLDDGEGRLMLDARWPGAPADFSPLSIDGTVSLDIRDGQLVEIEPGAGRVLGLLGIAQLPRRLTLDFGDFFDKGFAFDTLAGHVRIASAKASSDDLVIAGPAAEISISGTADLRAQVFDQTIEVVPRTGNLLTAVGAIAAGPVGAAIGAAANVVLRKPLGEMAARTYKVTGPWKEPRVEVIDRGPPDAAPPQPPQG